MGSVPTQQQYTHMITKYGATTMISELILMSKYVAESINQTTDCRTFQPHRALSTVYKTEDVAV